MDIASGRAVLGADRADPGAAYGARTIVRRFWPWARRDRFAALVVLLASLAVPGLEAASIWVFKLAVDKLLVPQDMSSFPRVVGAYATVALAGFLVMLGSEYLSAWVSERFLLALRTDLFRHILQLPIDYLTQRRLGDLLSSITSDVASIEEFLFSGSFDALVHAVRMPIFVAVVMTMDWKLALIALTVAPAFWFSAQYFAQQQRVFSRERRRLSGIASSIAEESLSNAPLVRACNREQLQAARFEEQGNAVRAVRLASARQRIFSSPLSDLLETTGVLLVMWLGVHELQHGAITLGGLVAFLTYLSRVYSPVRGLSSFTGAASSAVAGTERILELLDRSPDPVPHPEAIVLTKPRGIVEFQHVRFRYPGATSDTLADVSFRVDPGEVVAIIGPSGAGKSTVLRLLLRFHDPHEGRVLLDGHDLRTLALASARDAVAVLLQEPHLFHASVRDNISFGRPEADDAGIIRAARLADAHEFIQALPEGYATLLGQKGTRLSGGQRQRIALARALLREAPVLILDEPTTGLDAATTGRLLESLKEFAVGRAVIVLSHDARAVAWADRVLALNNGGLETPDLPRIAPLLLTTPAEAGGDLRSLP